MLTFILPFQISFHLHPDDWVKILEQLLLLVLIIGRWLLPKGEITREQLSQLLLVYIGMAADIIELFEAFKEKEVRYNRQLTLIILSLWTASLLQFCFVLSAAKARKSRPSFTKQPSRSSISDSGRCFTCRSEILSIMTTIILQDGSFLVLRMMLIFRYNVVSYTNIFFTAKNTLVNVLQLYRLVVLYAESLKLIKRQKSDPLFDDTFLVKAGNLANQIAKEEQMRQKREFKHVLVQTESSSAPDLATAGDGTKICASLSESDGVVIENPMHFIAGEEDKSFPPPKRDRRVTSKSKRKRKKSDSKCVAPEIMNITMVYLNPALSPKDINNVTDFEPDSAVFIHRMSGDNGCSLPDTASGTEINDELVDASVDLGDDVASNERKQSNEANEMNLPSNGNQSLKTPKKCRKTGQGTFKGVVKEVIRKGNNVSDIGLGDTCGGDQKDSGNLLPVDDVMNVESESSQDESVFTDKPTWRPAQDTDAVDIGSSFGEDSVAMIAYSNPATPELETTTNSEILAPTRKKTRWRWRRAKAIGRKKCSDLNQNSTEHISQDIELKSGSFQTADEI